MRRPSHSLTKKGSHWWICVLNGDNEPVPVGQNLIRDGNAIISEFYSPTIIPARAPISG